MATRIIRVEVCDICGAEEGLAKFRVTEQGGLSRAITICADKEHGAPVLRDIVKRALKQTPVASRQKAGRVASMNEVAAARTRKARKRA